MSTVDAPLRDEVRQYARVARAPNAYQHGFVSEETVTKPKRES